MSPSFQITDKDSFVEAVKRYADKDGNPLRTTRTYTWLLREKNGKWVNLPGLRLFHSCKIETTKGPMTWTFTETVPVAPESGEINHSGSVYEALAAVPRVIMRNRSGAL